MSTSAHIFYDGEAKRAAWLNYGVTPFTSTSPHCQTLRSIKVTAAAVVAARSGKRWVISHLSMYRNILCQRPRPCVAPPAPPPKKAEKVVNTLCNPRGMFSFVTKSRLRVSLLLWYLRGEFCCQNKSPSSEHERSWVRPAAECQTGAWGAPESLDPFV